MLEQDLLRLIRETEYTEEHTDACGNRYVVDGMNELCSGKIVSLRTIWQVEHIEG